MKKLIFIILIFNICFAQEGTRVIFDGEFTKDIHLKTTNTVRLEKNSLFMYIHQTSIFTSNNTNKLKRFKDTLMSFSKEEMNKNDKNKLCNDIKMKEVVNKYFMTINYTTTTEILGEKINTKFTLDRCP